MGVVRLAQIEDFEFSKGTILDAVSVEDRVAFVGIPVPAEPSFAIPNW